MMRMHGYAWMGLAAILAGLPVSNVLSQVATGAPAKAAEAPKTVCIVAEVDGVRALSVDCLSQLLMPPQTASDGNPGDFSLGLATAPSNRSGTFNYSAEQNRFGSNWGKSTIPQRPPPVKPVALP